jgi:serine/threonine protein kinase/Tol biopolymer transport system component
LIAPPVDITGHGFMTPDRYQQIDKVFQDALEREPKDRAAFLDQACAGDPVLRGEVEALIASYERAGSFIETPVFEAAPELVVDSGSDSLVGNAIGPYKIIAQLGSGGMGVVYLAFDSRLGRRIALKLLPSHLTRDEQRLRRFHQEARAASALNHPNIVTIFEIGRAGARPFIATEYIEGETLRQRLSNSTMTVPEALDVSLQVASAVSAAHGAGIVHRDIKPENVMVRPDGYIKVLDFGLAKLTESPSSVGTEAPTIARVDTEPGAVVGTASYMSPEQARGEKVDARTDIFSLGAVLYEMISGRLAFEGRSSGDVIASILHKEPPPLARYSREAPEALEWIVMKALSKNKEERYQTAKDMIIDLRRLKQRLEFEAESERSSPTRPSESEARSTAGDQNSYSTKTAARDTSGVEITRTTSSAEYLISEIKRHKRAALASLAIFSVLLAVGIYWALTTQSETSPLFQNMKIARLTTTGKAIEAAISPDGKYVAYVTDDGGEQSIWIKHIVTSSVAQIAPPTPARFSGLTFSLDGNYVYYVRTEETKPVNMLYQIPVLGGTPKKIIERVHGTITLSPDGSRIAFPRWAPMDFGRKMLIVANTDGSNERELASRKVPEMLVNTAWSPDGKLIACTVTNSAEGYALLVGVRADDGAETTVSSKKWISVGRIAWLPDGSGLIVPAADKPASPLQIWYLSYPSGLARRITNDLNGYNQVSATSDSKSLVTVQSDSTSSIWIVPDGDTTRARQITSGTGKYGAGVLDDDGSGFVTADVGGGVCWTPDGRILYHSSAAGKLDISIMNADGRNQRQLTSGSASSFFPSITPDGRYIAFDADRDGKLNVWRMDTDGGNIRQLTNNTGHLPSCTPDSKWVIYSQYYSGQNNALLKVPIDGGESVLVAERKGQTLYRSAISPDGRFIACNYIPSDSDWRLHIAAFPFDGTGPPRVFEIITTNIMREIRWTADGRYLTYIETRDGVSNIWGQPLDGGQPIRLTDFKSDLIFSWDWSRDGKQLAVARGGISSDVVLISDFR